MPSLIGNKPNQVPTNGDLGREAFVDRPTRRPLTAVATEGQTTFTITGGYAPGWIDVYMNGSKLFPTDYTANGTTIVLTAGAIAGDELEFIIWG
jgi:hypothetical protein